MPALHDRLAVHAELRHHDGRSGDRTIGQFVIQRAGENARRRRLADAADAGQDPGLRNATGLERVRDGAHHRVLADQIVKAGRPVFAGEHAVICAARCRAVEPALSARALAKYRSSSGCPFRPKRPRGDRLKAASRQYDEIRGGRLTSDPNRSSLGLLPSGPDPVGEWLVHCQSPSPIWGQPTGKASQLTPAVPFHLAIGRGPSRLRQPR